jgi:hypothetical protein
MTDQWLEDRPDWLGGELPEAQAAPGAGARLNPEDVLWTVQEVAETLRVDVKTVRKLLENFPTPQAWFRIGGRSIIRVRDWAVQQLIREG